MSGVAAAIVGGAVVGGYMASEASSDASSKIAESTDKATAATSAAAAEANKNQWEMYQQSRQDQLPWLTAGSKALETLSSRIEEGPGEFKADPGYQFRLDEGNRNILQSAAQGAGTQSGATLKALQDYGQNTATNAYDNFLNNYYKSLTPLQSLAGVGQTTSARLGSEGMDTASRMGSTAMNAANAVGSGYMQAGQAQATNIMNQSNIANQALQTGANALGTYLGNRPQPQPDAGTWV